MSEPALRFNEAVAKHAPLDDYEQGWVDGIFAFAWMRDGTYFVGTRETPLGQAVDTFLTHRRERLRA